MDRQEKIEWLNQHSFAFDVDLTLDEIEWTRILGRSGMGHRLLGQMVDIGGDFFALEGPAHVPSETGELLGFRLDGDAHELRLGYEQPLTANLQTAVKRLLDGVNGALRRQTKPYRFVCTRDTCTGAGCTYRLMLLPTAWLGELEDELQIVAGLSLEDYELQRPFDLGDANRPELGGGVFEAR